jgi:hypothetical protein
MSAFAAAVLAAIVAMVLLGVGVLIGFFLRGHLDARKSKA